MEKKDIDEIASELRSEAEEREPDEEFDYDGHCVEMFYNEGLPGFKVDGSVVPVSVLVDRHPIEFVGEDVDFWEGKMKDFIDSEF